MTKQEFIEEYDGIEVSWIFSKETEKDALTSITPFEKDLNELIKEVQREAWDANISNLFAYYLNTEKRITFEDWYNVK